MTRLFESFTSVEFIEKFAEPVTRIGSEPNGSTRMIFEWMWIPACMERLLPLQQLPLEVVQRRRERGRDGDRVGRVPLMTWTSSPLPRLVILSSSMNRRTSVR